MRLFLLMLCLSIPGTSSAAVLINEVAWMGTTLSANDEWIELYNSAESSVSVDGWVLSDGMNLSIALAGSIPGQSYAVLERTDDASAPGSAFVVYTGALSNTGATLTLYRQDNSIEDQVAGGDGWEQIGGDNTTKETAQYTSTGWITAESTPGSQNVAREVEEKKQDTASTTKQRTQASSDTNETIELQLPDVHLALSIDAPAIAYVHQPVALSVTPSGLGKTLLNSLVYTWNFGDFTTSSQKSPTHIFTHAGEYIVTVHATFARHEQIARKKIIVLPVMLALSRDLVGNLQLHNNAKYEMDISGYRVVVGDASLTLPEHSIILPNATVTILKEKLDGAIEFAQLFDQENTLVATYYRHNDVPKPASTYQASAVQAVSHTSNPSENFVFHETDPEVLAVSEKVASSTVSTEEPTQRTVSEQPTKETIPEETMPLLGLLGIMTLGILGVYFGGSKVT